MTKGAKIAIGCAAVVLVAGIAVFLAIFGAAWWAKGKVEHFAGEQKQIERLQKKANTNVFHAPSDGVISEDRLLKFLDVRKRVYAIYEKHKDDLETRQKKEKPDLSDLTSTVGLVNEIRMAQAEGLADAGMSEDEYRYLVEQVYKTMWASEIAKSTGGKSVSEAATEAYDKAAQEMQKALQQSKQAEQNAGSREAEANAEGAHKDVRDGLEELQKQAAQLREGAQQMDVPPANIALFRKYEAEIKKYAMSGLAWIGL